MKLKFGIPGAASQMLQDLHAGQAFKHDIDVTNIHPTVYIRTDEWNDASTRVKVVNLETGVIVNLSHDLAVIPLAAKVHVA